MSNFTLRISNSHYLLVTNEGGIFLIDTGSPLSFCSGNTNTCITIGDQKYIIQPNQGMVDTVNNGNLIQEKVDGLIGLDVLRGHTLEFDKKNERILVDEKIEENNYCHSVPIEIKSFMGQSSILVDLEINRHPIKAIIDTGAWISYLSSEYLNSVEAIETIEDYNPMLGTYQTTKHEVTLSMGDYEQRIFVGKMTNMIERMMNMIGISFVVGIAAIECERICLDLRGGRLMFS